MKVKVLLVDVDDTLLDFRASARTALSSTLQKYGLEMTDKIWDTYWKINGGLWKQLEQGKITHGQLFEIRFQTIFRVLGISLDHHSFEQSFHEALHEAAVPFAGAAPFLSSVKVPIYAATNGWKEQQEHRLALAGLDSYLSGVFSSEIAGAHKPSPVFYDYVYDALCQLYPGLLRSEILMIGDNLQADIAGAEAAGFRVLHILPGMIGEVVL